MLTNYHTHTTYCDGENTPEEIILYAIERGFDAIGFSGHGYTPFDLSYCMKDTEGYKREINALKEKYSHKIEILCGTEEDAMSPQSRDGFDYVIGSSHYFCVDGKYYPIDSGYDYFKECLGIFDYDIPRLAETYFGTFADYVMKHRPHIIGHFDLITKFDELDTPLFLNNGEYLKIAEKYIKALSRVSVFEVNTGAMARGLRKTPYLGEELLSVLKREGGEVILSSDSHAVSTLDYKFGEMEHLLREAKFDYVLELHGNGFEKRYINI